MRDFHAEEGPSHGENLVLTVLCVPNSLDSGIRSANRVWAEGLGLRVLNLVMVVGEGLRIEGWGLGV